MRAVQVLKDESGQRAELTEIPDGEIGEGDVSIAVEYSAVNFKDGLGVTGAVLVVERFPVVAGIDLAGTVVEAGDRHRWIHRWAQCRGPATARVEAP